MIGDGQPFALLAQFDTVAEVMCAAEQVRDAGYLAWDVHSPFPIHHINHSMGLRPTILPWITLVHGLVGTAFGMWLMWWMNATTVPGISASVQGYQFLSSGKPMYSLPANIPIIFETTVLFAAIGTLLGMLGLNKMPMLYNPLARSTRFLRADFGSIHDCDRSGRSIVRDREDNGLSPFTGSDGDGDRKRVDRHDNLSERKFPHSDAVALGSRAATETTTMVDGRDVDLGGDCDLDPFHFDLPSEAK